MVILNEIFSKKYFSGDCLLDISEGTVLSYAIKHQVLFQTVLLFWKTLKKTLTVYSGKQPISQKICVLEIFMTSLASKI